METVVTPTPHHPAGLPYAGRITPVMDGLVSPLDAVWDPVGQTYLLSQNARVESFTRDWRNAGRIFTDHTFDDTPYVVIVGESLICANSRGGGLLVRFSLENKQLVQSREVEYRIGRLDSFGKGMLLASCYTDQGDTFLVFFDEGLREVDRIEFGKWKTLPPPADMQYTIVDENRLLLLEQREWSSQCLVDYRLDTRQVVNRIPIPGIQMLITCIQYHEDVVYAAGHSFFAMLGMTGKLHSITHLNTVTLSFMRRVSSEHAQELIVADNHNGFIFRYPLDDQGPVS